MRVPMRGPVTSMPLALSVLTDSRRTVRLTPIARQSSPRSEAATPLRVLPR